MQGSQVPVLLDQRQCGLRLPLPAWTIVEDEGQMELICRIVGQKRKIHEVFDQDPDC
jgi:hypothetical protein